MVVGMPMPGSFAERFEAGLEREIEKKGRRGERGSLRKRPYKITREKSPIRKRKFYQLSEAFGLFFKGLQKISEYYPISRNAIKEFRRAVMNGEVKIMVEPGTYLERRGNTITDGRIVYVPGTHTRVIELPAAAFDGEGNLRPKALLTLWHELTHAVRSFDPKLRELPTPLDEATTNFIADSIAKYYITKGAKPRYIPINRGALIDARSDWLRTLVYKPKIVEGVLSKVSKGGRFEEKYKESLFKDFARGIRLKEELQEYVRKRLPIELLKRVDSREYALKLHEEIRKALREAEIRRGTLKSTERIAKKYEINLRLSPAELERLRPHLERLESYFGRMKQGHEKLGGILRKDFPSLFEEAYKRGR